jgi:hypothetical protein
MVVIDWVAWLVLAVHKGCNPEHRQEVADFWGIRQHLTKSGLTATEMFERSILEEM